MTPWIQELTVRLSTGLGNVAEEIRDRHAKWILSQQQPDGGFAGRMGGSDLYYTTFGLRSLSILGELYGPPAERAAGFLRGQMTQPQTVVDFFSLLMAAKLVEAAAGIDVFAEADPQSNRRIAEFLESLQRDDGGFAKAPEGAAGSTYNTFLVLLVSQLIDHTPSRPDDIVRFLDSQANLEEGGWREIRASKRAGTNPTAAAVGSLQILGHPESIDRELTLDFLCEMQTDEGGLRANTRIPIADLLSSFTGALTLENLDAANEIDRAALAKFVNYLQSPDGGFLAAVWDEARDVEYTFYGLGCLALLATDKPQ